MGKDSSLRLYEMRSKSSVCLFISPSYLYQCLPVSVFARISVKILVESK